MPDSRTLEDCQIPVFKTHPTPINVSVKPKETSSDHNTSKRHKKNRGGGGGGSGGDDGGGSANAASNNNTVSQGCGCTIL